MTRAAAPTALAPSSVVADAFRDQRDSLSALYRRHVDVCWAAEHGRWCRVCTALLAAADDAGKKVALAEEWARRGMGR